MPWEAKQQKDGIVFTRVWDTIDDEEVVAMVMELSEMIKLSGVTLFLTDFREVHSEVSVSRLYELPRLYDELGVPRTARQALILPLIKHRIEDYQFYYDVCRNMGYNSRLFENVDEARQWLLED